ncbi:MAG: IclR family transcriptional regulator, partial [Burkholderiaceae bacterium]|nr:IclR family transcriptional regulator [Burkholderiaceae bacterium]
ALATPVFDGFGQMVLCLAAIGPSVSLDIGSNGLPGQYLRESARTLSQRLGAPGAGLVDQAD